MALSSGFEKTSGVWDKLKKLVSTAETKLPVPRTPALQHAADRGRLERGVPYIGIGDAPSNFNASGNLPGTTIPKKKYRL